jgi:prepilin-type N-terminal cleavage/methylation domain-containing protein
MKRVNRTEKNGFTLIEILMVVAIIGLLSVIVLASLKESRTKAENQAGNLTVKQYVNALELFHTDDPSLPFPSDAGGTDICMVCPFGGGICALGTDDGVDLDNFHNDLLPYISTPTACRYTGPSDFGVLYRCSASLGGCADGYQIEWRLSGLGQKCFGTIGTDAGGDTTCLIDGGG